jgi:hypothetical protein
MFRSVLTGFGLCAAALSLTACQVSKSSNPLSPTVAGPIPGVNITAPKPVDPTVGSQIAVNSQPVTLTVENASSSGPRPLNYLFEVATDASFNNKVFTRDSIPPGDSGRTALKLPDALATGRTYYWRARAQDGANTGAYSAAVNFNVFTPIQIGPPAPVLPAAGGIANALRAGFLIGNAFRSGPVGAITYQIEVATTDSFANKITWTTAEQTNQTNFVSPQDLAPSTVYFWHVRAADPTTIGPWCATQTFSTPAMAAAPTPPPTTGGGSSKDGFDMRTAAIWDNPQDLGSWPATATITSIQFTPSAFLVDFDKRTGGGRWPDVPFGTGNLEYTLGMCVNISGQWNCSATVQFWFGRDLAASGRPNEIAINWWYDRRWGNLMGYQPAMGETVGIFVAAGNLRDSGTVITKERSNVVLMPFGGSYQATAAARLPLRR